jgi:hypothetical protein
MKKTIFATNYMAILNSEFDELEWMGCEHSDNGTYKTFTAYKDTRKVSGKIGLCFNNADASVVLEYRDYVEPPLVKDIVLDVMSNYSSKFSEIDEDSNSLREMIRLSLAQLYYVETKSVFKVKVQKESKGKKKILLIDIKQKFKDQVINHNLIYDFKKKNISLKPASIK